MLWVFVTEIPLAGGGGMAQVSLFERMLPWGAIMLVVCVVATVAIRRIYR